MICYRLDSSDNDGSPFSQAAQIIIALIHCALGFLCFRLFFEEDIKETGYVPVPVTLIYTFWTVPFVSKSWYS